MDEYRNDSPWGAWHDSIADGLASVAEYMSRCERSLSGEIAPDRFYFADKARALRDAAISLVRRCDEVERWIGECGDDVEDGVSGDGAVSWTTCALPIGHNGAHDGSPAETQVLRADRALQVLVTETVAIADAVGRAVAQTEPAGADAPDSMDEVGSSLVALRRSFDRLRSALAP